MMKKNLYFVMTAMLIMTGGCQQYDDSALQDEINGLKARIVYLEQWVASVNSNISALQDIVAALQDSDYVTGITTFTSPEPGGYIISFTKSDDVVIANGRDGQDGELPQIAVKQDTDGVYYWTLNGEWIIADGNKMPVTGENGVDGQNGITPKIRINPNTAEWEISYDDGINWDATGMTATGEQDSQGDAIFANNGVDNSNPDYVEFTLADGVTKIKVPKYRLLGLDFAQPEAFAAGETKEIQYTAAGNVAVIEFVNIPDGWSVTVNMADSKFSVTAPATFNSSNRGGKVIILISDDVQHSIIRTVNFTANTGGSGSDAGADATAVTIEGYSGNTITVYYTDDTYNNITKNLDGVFAVSKSDKTIHHIDLDEYTIFVGRKADGSAIALRLRNGNLILHNAVDGYIPIGTYSEFQLIDDSRTNPAASYKQEADLDLLDLEWMPIGNILNYFTGTFDGDSHTIANLKITGSYDGVGLFGIIRDASLRNIHIVSGSVSGNDEVGGICGEALFSSFSACSNAATVSGDNGVGGICGYTMYSSIITACYNTGTISGNENVGGICGGSDGDIPSITACYNTGSVSGNYGVGGISGSPYVSYITACYNTGSVSGNSNIGGVCGFSYDNSMIIACYWKDVSDDDANYGIGEDYSSNSPSNIGTAIFSSSAWPTISTHTQWGTGDGSGDGKYWKSLGGWNGGNPIYPKLFFEE